MKHAKKYNPSKKGKPETASEKRKRRYKSKYNWEKLKHEWDNCDLSRKEFSVLQNIPFSTFCMRKDDDGVPLFSVAKRKMRRLGSCSRAAKFRKKLEKAAQSDDDAREFLQALQQGKLLLEEIMLSSGEQFINMVEALPVSFNTAGEAARVAIQASVEHRKLALDLQGIPAEGEGFGWPLTKAFWPFPYQRDFIFDTPSSLAAIGEKRELFAFIGGIGSGKTRCGAEKFGDIAYRNRGTRGAIYAPTYRMLEDATKHTFFDVLNKKGISYHYRASEKVLVLFGDTEIMLRSMDDPQHLRGPEIGFFWIDEAGQMKEGSAFDIIMGRFRSQLAKEPAGLITTTPDGFNWLYDALVVNADLNKVKLYFASTEQNTALREGYVEGLTNLYDERFAEQELHGKFLNVFTGQAYWNFSRDKSINNNIKYEKTLPLILAFDLNVEPMCWNVLQCRRHKDGYDIDIILDEIHIRTASTEDAAKEFLRRYRTHKAGVHIYGDATWNTRHTSAKVTRTDYTIIEKALNVLPGVEYFVGTSNPAVTDRIAAHNARLRSLSGRRCLFINGECEETVKDYERTAFKPGTRDLLKTDPERTHHTDAVGYYCAKKYPFRQTKIKRI